MYRFLFFRLPSRSYLHGKLFGVKVYPRKLGQDEGSSCSRMLVTEKLPSPLDCSTKNLRPKQYSRNIKVHQSPHRPVGGLWWTFPEHQSPPKSSVRNIKVHPSPPFGTLESTKVRRPDHCGPPTLSKVHHSPQS